MYFRVQYDYKKETSGAASIPVVVDISPGESKSMTDTEMKREAMKAALAQVHTNPHQHTSHSSNYSGHNNTPLFSYPILSSLILELQHLNLFLILNQITQGSML